MGALLNRRRYMGGGGAPQPIANYFRLTAIDDCVFTLKIASGLSTSDLTDVSYSIDEGATWVTTQNVNNTEVVVTTPTVYSGSSVIWKGHAVSYAYNYSGTYSAFTSTGKFNASGNLAFLFSEEDTVSNIYERMFCGMFYNSSNLVSAENLIIPINDNNFNPVNNQRQYVCAYMFMNCTSLTTTPTINWSKLGDRQLLRAFQGCSSLTKITMLATNISLTNCLYNWVLNVPSGGTFIKNSAMTSLSTGASGIPSGWTVEDYIE